MYPGNQYYVGQQGTTNQQHVQGAYLQMSQQQGHQGYSVTALQQLQQQQLQQQQAVLQQANNTYATSQQPQVPANPQRRLSKQTSSQQQHLMEHMRLHYNPTPVAGSQIWAPSGLMSAQQVSDQQQPAQTLSWQHRSDSQALHSDQRQSTVASVRPGLRDMLTAQHAMTPSVVPQLPSGSNRVQGSQVANMAILQQQSVSRLVHQPVNQPLNSNSSANWESSRRQLQTQRLLQSPPQVPSQQQSLNRSNSIPPSLSNMPLAAGRMMTNRSNQSPHAKTMTQHAMTLHNQKIDVPGQAIATPQPDKRDKIHIRFDQNAKQAPPTQQQQSAHNQQTTAMISKSVGRKISDASLSKDEDEPECDTKTPTQIENKTRIIIDDDIEIVGTKEAEVMSHIRSDCPVHPYQRIDQVSVPPNEANTKRCPKCFCYICDKLAHQCEKWLDPDCPHCNANSRSSCWKARRNMKNSPMMNQLTAEEVTPEIKKAGALAMEYIIRVREEYISYRNGIPCEFNSVPCDCACHRSSKTVNDACAQCKAVHDMKKKFNYDPVRKEILEITHTIQRKYGDKPASALILFEALLSELCSHRPADFNHMTRMPSNPDTKCQCNTPQIMDEYIEVELIKIFTMNEVTSNLKDKFLKCVNASIQPLQLKDVMKRFMEMRHWDDLLLRAVLSGQNTAGRLSRGDTLRETSLVIEMRVNKLAEECRYLAITRYLKAVKVQKTASNSISDGTPISIAMSKWNLMYLAKRGCFREVCTKLAENVPLIHSLPTDFYLELLSSLSGVGLPPKTELVSSFNSLKSPCYEIISSDKTVLLFLCLVYIEGNKSAEDSFTCHLWLGRWLNEESLRNDASLVRAWMQSSKELHDMTRQAMSSHQCTQYLLHCKAIAPQAALMACSVAITQFLAKSPKNIAYVPDIIEVYKNNEWALYYLFSQPAVLSSGSHLMLEWLTGFLKSTRSMMGMFNLEAFSLLIAKNDFANVFAFLQQWLDPQWTNYNTTMMQYVLKVTAKFASRIINETTSDCGKYAEWLCDVVLVKILEKNLQRDEAMFPLCDVIGQACCCSSAKNISLYSQLLPSAVQPSKLNDIFALHQKRFQSNLLKPDEVAQLFHLAVKHGCPVVLKTILTYYTEKHECSQNGSASLEIMEEVVKILGSPQHEFAMAKTTVLDSYSNLCSHETLCWLICAKCSARMPDEWAKVWCALGRNGMRTELNKLVQHTLEQFSSWVKELCVQEESDIQRLLRCLDTFVVKVVTTLMDCKFDEEKTEALISETRYFIANIQLRHEYLKIIQRVFEAIRKKREAKRKKSLPPPTVAKPQVTQPPPQPESRAEDTKWNKPVESLAAREQERAVDAVPKQRVTPNVPTTVNVKKSEKHNSHSEQMKSQADGDRTSSGLKLTISKSRLLSPTATPSSGSMAETNLSSPPLGSPAAFCPQCGDAMTSSFKCSKCHARKSVEVKCPNCHQTNRGLKGYSCRFCYSSLLGVLTIGESSKQEEPLEPSHEKTRAEKKHKKLKRKKPEDSSHSRDTPGNNTANVPKERDSPPRSERPPSTHIPAQEASAAKRVKTNPQKERHELADLKDTSWRSESPKHNQKVLNKIPADDFLPQRPKPHQRVKEAQQKERPNPKPITPPKVSSNLFLNFKREFPSQSLSDSSSSSSDEDRETRQVPPLILKKKEVSELPKIKEVKNNRPEVQNPSTPPPKRCVTQGNAMSKKQRNILQRMKNIGKVPKIAKITKTSPKASTERDTTRRRKPGPLSRTSYYVIHPHWVIPKHIKLPYTTDLPSFCVVHLKSFPPDKMRIIRKFLPDLRLTRLYA